MATMVRFIPVEVISQIWFISGREKRSGFSIMTIILVPKSPSGRPVITTEPFPEIYFQ